MGKLIGQGAIRSEVVGSARQQGVGPGEIEEVKVRFSIIHLSERILAIWISDYVYITQFDNVSIVL